MNSKIIDDDDRLQRMIDQSQFSDQDYWFSRARQKLIAFHLARDLVLDGQSPDVAISTAKAFVDDFYDRVIRRGSWER
jgi:hypothetical protein